jgi:2-oxo-4-hydroxy-4-carboxy-5-ureidoimidazoline decarboxylase
MVGKRQMKHVLADVNAMSHDSFVREFGDVVEHSPWVAEAAARQRPFRQLADLHHCMCEAIWNAGPARWAVILRAHPELSGKEAQSGMLTDFSTSEQKGLGLDRLSRDEFMRIQNFNRAYREKFGFPFVVCVRLLGSRAELFAEMDRRLGHTVDDELRTGTEQVTEICRLRLENLVEDRAGA